MAAASAAPALSLGHSVEGFGRALIVEDIDTEPMLGTRRAPPGWEYLVLDLTFTNLGAETIEGFAPARRTTVMEDDEFPYIAEQAGKDLDEAFWREQSLLAGTSLSGTLVYLVPKNRGDLSLVHETGTGPIALQIGKLGSEFVDSTPVAEAPETTEPEDEVPNVDEADSAFVAVEGASAGLAASAPVWAGEIGEVAAGQGKQYFWLDLTFTNRTADVYTQLLADYILVVEDGQYTYSAHWLTAEGGSALATEWQVLPGQSISGRLVYELPETADKLALVYFGPDGPLGLDITPDAAAAPAPALIAGPVTAALPGGDGARLTLSVFDPAELGPPSPEAGTQYVIADFALRLDGAGPLTTLPLDPAASFVLRDEAGGTYRPADIRFARRFERTELWSGQTSRGRLAFAVPAGAAAPQSLTLELPDLVGLPLPYDREPVAVAVVAPEKTVLSLVPASPPVSGGICEAVTTDGPPAALFLGEDRITRGDWHGRYGGDGHVLINYDGGGNDRSRLPSYIDSYAYSSGTRFYVWSAATDYRMALKSLSGDHVAATAYADISFSFTLEAKEAKPHTLALYFLGWDLLDKEQTIVIYDAASDEILDRRTIRKFHDGIYLVYEVQGSVRVEITSNTEWDAVLSGIFWSPFNTANEAEVAAAMADVVEGRRTRAVLTARRGDKSFMFAITGDGERGEAGDTHVTEDRSRAATAQGLNGRYMEGPGYGRLLAERRDPALEYSWWRNPLGDFPGEETLPANQPLWAEWEGEILIPSAEELATVSLVEGQSSGTEIRSSSVGICVEGVEPGSPAEAGGLRAGDIITRVIDLPIPEWVRVAFRMNAAAGGHLYVDGLRVLSTDGAQVETSLLLNAGKRRLRAAAVRREDQATAEEPPVEPPQGPTLSWRLTGMSDFDPVPALALYAAEPGTWRRNPRQAAQVGLEWLQSAAVVWQRENNCYGCHVQSQALTAMAIGRANDYIVSGEAYADLLDGLTRYQKDDGHWHKNRQVEATTFGASSLVAAKRRGKEGRDETFLRAVRYILTRQNADGRVPLDGHRGLPIEQGDFITSANARIAFSAAAELAPDAEASVFKEAESRTLAWLVTAEPSTNQDRAMRMLGLATEDRGSARELLAAARADLLAHQRPDGGWAEVDGEKSSAYATGQALYALKVAGQSIASAPFQRGVDWLLANQFWTGAWASTSSSQFAATMWPVIALVGSFQGVGVEVIADTCIEGSVELAARAVSDESIELVRFVIDGEVVGTVHEADAEGLYRADWNAETTAHGIHELRIEAVQDGAVRGEDQTTFHTGPVGGQCKGILNVVSTGEPIAGTAAPNIELILDASGSMRERNRRVDGRLKIDVAKELMAETIAGLPDGIMAGLRVYGRNIREGRDGDCVDSELVLPFSKLDKARLIQEVRNVQALGTTPIAYSLVRAARDLAAVPGEKLIILVTDGKEECGSSPSEVAAKLAELGMTLRVDVVGFALSEEAVKREMERVAEITGGRFFDAQNTEELRRGIQRALAAPYDVFDAEGTRVGGGVTSRGAIEVPAGVYTIKVRGVDDEIAIANVRIASNQATGVTLTKEGANVEIQILDPVAKEQVDWTAAPVDASDAAPAVAEEPEALEQFARLNEALEKLENELEQAPRQVPPADEDPLHDMVREMQSILAEKGYDPGPADGLMGPKTRNAIGHFQRDAGLPETGRPSAAVLETLRAYMGRASEPEPVPVTSTTQVEAAREVDVIRGTVTDFLDTSTAVVAGQIVTLAGLMIDDHPFMVDVLRKSLVGLDFVCTESTISNLRGYFCDSNMGDFGETLLKNGLARAVGNAPPHYLAAEAQARASEQGHWLSPYWH